ncbi:MAG TPA: hypothetical protein VFB62_10100, partial [Polyangiaceae bacterium]|nr:hypothetical protein [Polyangiaceae bacterium]
FRAILLGGAPPSAELLSRLRGSPVALTWGMTEAGSQVATSFVGEHDLVPLAFVRVETRGERLALRGPLAELVTNDRGYVDIDGRVHVHGRADSVIVSGGEKIDPAEIEGVLEEHPAIAEAAVVAVPNKAWGERPVAVLVPRGDAMPSRAEIRAFCRARLAAFKAPDDMVWCTSLPKSALGKVARARVRELALDVLGNETAGAQPVDEERRRRNGLEAIERDESMHQRRPGAHLAIGAAKRVGEANGSLRETLDLELDIDPLVHAERFVEVGFGVNQRHAHALAVDEPVDAPADLQHQLFESGVAVLEDATEEGDARAIDLVETNRHPMNERHGDERQ